MKKGKQTEIRTPRTIESRVFEKPLPDAGAVAKAIGGAGVDERRPSTPAVAPSEPTAPAETSTSSSPISTATVATNPLGARARQVEDSPLRRADRAGDDLRRVTVYLPRDLAKALKQAAADRECSLSHAVEDAVRGWLKGGA